MQKTGQITRWDAERAFGFIRSPDSVADVFFHLRDFQGPVTPRMGMAVVFEEIHVGGKGPRAMAVRPSAQAVGAPGRAADPRGAGSAASREAPQSARRGPSAAQRTTGAHPRAASRPAAQVRRRTQRVTSLPAGELLLISAMAVVWMAMLADPLMVLVNHANKMPDNYTFDTKECGSSTSVNKTLQTVACDAFLAMQKAAAADGVTVWMQSGYRSVKYQTSLYERKTKYYLDKGYDNATAKEKAAAVVNPPGYSEHNCGLAADLNSPEHTGLDEGFEKTAAFRWLCEHAGDYGFILRYPKDAEDKTEIIYEPWHWRYVGVENAAKINASGLCFEEYIETLQSIAAEG